MRQCFIIREEDSLRSLETYFQGYLGREKIWRSGKSHYNPSDSGRNYPFIIWYAFRNEEDCLSASDKGAKGTQDPLEVKPYLREIKLNRIR